MMPLARWQHALISLIILMALFFVVFIAVISPLKAYHSELTYELETKQENLTRFEKIANQKDVLIPFYQKELNKQQSQTHLMPSTPISLAAAKLQEQVKQILQSTSGQLLSTQALPDQEEGLFIPVKIRVHMKSDLSTLLNTLHRLESGKPLGFVENLQIQLTGRSRASNRQGRQASNTLDSRFDLKVYMFKEKA